MFFIIWPKQLLMLAIIVLNLFVLIESATARVRLDPLSEYIETSKLIVIGTVRSVKENDDASNNEEKAKAVIAVETVLLGTPVATVDIYYEPGWSISPHFKVQERCIFFLQLWEGKWRLNHYHAGKICESKDNVLDFIVMSDQEWHGQKTDDFVQKIQRYIKRTHEKMEDGPDEEMNHPTEVRERSLLEYIESSKLIIVGTVRSIKNDTSDPDESKAVIAVETVLLGTPSATVDIYFKPSLSTSPSFKAQERCMFFLRLWEGKWVVNNSQAGKVCESADNMLKAIDMDVDLTDQKMDDFILKIQHYLERISRKVDDPLKKRKRNEWEKVIWP